MGAFLQIPVLLLTDTQFQLTAAVGTEGDNPVAFHPAGQDDSIEDFLLPFVK